MSKERMCLLCKTKNVIYDAEFLAKRAYFSAPKLRELRVKWNEAITKMHPFLKTYVDNVNTYKICDLHFRESDVKKSFEKNGNIFRLPLSKWGLKIEALPLSSENLESDKNQKVNANLTVGEINIKTEVFENEEEESEGQQSEISLVDHVQKNKLENNNGSEQTDEIEEDNNKTKNVQETQKGKENETILEPTKSLPSKENPPENDVVPEKEKMITKLITKSIIGPMRSDYSNKVEVKVAPYPVLKSIKKEVNFKGPQLVQIKSGKNQVFVVPRGAQVIPLSPMSSAANASSAIQVPVVTQVTSLKDGSQITKLIPITTIGSKPSIPQRINNVVPKTTVSSGSQGPLVKAVTLVSRVNSDNSSDKRTPVSGVTKVKSISSAEKVPPSSRDRKKVSADKIASPLKADVNVESPLLNSPIEMIEEYDTDKLIKDLKRYPLPTGWAYSLTTSDQILFTLYNTFWKYPIFLRMDDNRKAMISVGYLATNFIPYELEIECFANLINGLRKVANLNWCKGIGFNNNNHSDLCGVLVKRSNSRCQECARIRKNEQRLETEEILRRQKQKRGKHLKVIRNMKQANKRLEAKVCKLKLMVDHLKSKQCADCLHEKFMKKALDQTESASKSE